MNKFLMPIWISATVLSFTSAGCASKGSTAEGAPKKAKGHYVTMPAETGSRLPRKIWVADDGSVSNDGSQVERTGAGTLGDLQRKGGINTKGGN